MPEQGDAGSFLADMSAELAKLADNAGFKTLAHLYKMAALEAEGLAPSGGNSRSGKGLESWRPDLRS